MVGRRFGREEDGWEGLVISHIWGDVRGTYHEDTSCTVDGEYVAYDMIDPACECSSKFLAALLVSHAWKI